MRFSCRSPGRIRSLGLALALIVLFTGLEWGEEVPPKGVLPSPPVEEPTVRIFTDKETYAPGEEILITVEVEHESFLYLYDIDPAGTITLLFPNRFQPDPLVSPGKLLLPGEDYRLVVGEPEGRETLVALASSVPLPGLRVTGKNSFLSVDASPEAFAQSLSEELGESPWRTAWTQITVYRPKATVYISSQPPSARIYVDGHYQGRTPKELVLPAGEVTVTLEKAGYQRFSETFILADQSLIDLEARLQEALPSPPTTGVGVPLSFIGVDLGIDSLGVEIGLTRPIGLTSAVRFTGEEVPDLSLPGEGGTFNLGPEWEIGLRLHAHPLGGFGLILGVGVAFQTQVTIPSFPASFSPLGITIEPITQTVVYPTFTLGLEANLGYVCLQCSYHNRRGIVIGVGIAL